MRCETKEKFLENDAKIIIEDKSINDILYFYEISHKRNTFQDNFYTEILEIPSNFVGIVLLLKTSDNFLLSRKEIEDALLLSLFSWDLVESSEIKDNHEIRTYIYKNILVAKTFDTGNASVIYINRLFYDTMNPQVYSYLDIDAAKSRISGALVNAEIYG